MLRLLLVVWFLFMMPFGLHAKIPKGSVVFPVDPSVGDTIDVSEAERFGLFKNIDGLVEVIYFRAPTNRYFCQIKQKDVSGQTFIKVNECGEIGIEYIRKDIANPSPYQRVPTFAQIKPVTKANVGTGAPNTEEIEIIGTLAMQQLYSYSPKAAEAVINAETADVTEHLVKTMFKRPIEVIAGNDQLFLVTVFSLAHQWGLNRISINYINKQERLIQKRMRGIEEKKGKLKWRNFFLGLSTLGYSLSKSSSRDPIDKLSDELGIARNYDSLSTNRRLAEVYDSKVESYEDALLKLNQLKEHLQSRNRVLATYRSWLLNTHSQMIREKAPAASRVLLIS